MSDEHRWTVADSYVPLAGFVIAGFDTLILARLEDIGVVILIYAHLAKTAHVGAGTQVHAECELRGWVAVSGQPLNSNKRTALRDLKPPLKMLRITTTEDAAPIYLGHFDESGARESKRLTSSRSIENAPAPVFQRLPEVHVCRSVSDTALGLHGHN
jgi:hypothetical protein